ESGLAVSGIDLNRFLEVSRSFPIVIGKALGVILHSFIELVHRSLVTPLGDQNLDADRSLLAWVNHLLARAVWLVAHLYAFDGVDPGHEARQAQRRALADHPDRLAVHKHL